MKEFYVKDVAAHLGGTITSFFLVAAQQLRSKRDGGSYLHFALTDRTGKIDAKLWGELQTAEDIAVDDIVKVRGRVAEYNQRPEITVEKIRKATEDEIQLTDFLPATDCDVDQLWQALLGFVGSIADPALRCLLESVLEDPQIAPRFRRAPAAKIMHHAYLGGLLEHVVSLCRASALMQQNYPWLSRDLLLAGAILHDVGKIEELSFERSFSYSDEGRLVGHLAIGLRILREHAKLVSDLSPSLLMMLEHLILSHHGEKEMGAPVEPATAEALLLHHLDNMDSKMAAVRKALMAEEGASWTSRIPALGRGIMRGPQGH